MGKPRKEARPRRDEYAERTREALLAAACELFGRAGFSETSLDTIAAKARLTKGAVYHHFKNKREVFRAAYELLAAELVRDAERAGQCAAGPLDKARASTQALLERCTDPRLRRVLFLDGPSVLGGIECREIDRKYALGMVRAVLEPFVQAGEIDVASDLVLGLLIEGSQLVARSKDPAAARARVESAIFRMVLGLSKAGPEARLTAAGA